MGYQDDEQAQRDRDLARITRAIEREGDARLREVREGRLPAREAIVRIDPPARPAPQPTWAQLRARAIEAEGDAKLAAWRKGNASAEETFGASGGPPDRRPRCPECGAIVQIDEEHRELLGAMSPYPRVEWRCDPATRRAHRLSLNEAARSRGEREPFRNL